MRALSVWLSPLFERANDSIGIAFFVARVKLAGVVVYMAYGVWHSSERQSDDPECSLLENVMCDDVSSDDVLPLAEQRREVLVETF
ncbi:hypothetical protein HPB52_017811 [Rhipicephalus sanguineus]|uniref:Uncharacterized protein n=1 Tax=Rhipicephalus sanguineus TaxID=34632 RepID=A0A9D4SZD2_RHISA|nr:hypothetical protein HPB52_017811 [Rhipicephalus sanguineus]